MLLKKWVHRDGKNATSKQRVRARAGGVIGPSGIARAAEVQLWLKQLSLEVKLCVRDPGGAHIISAVCLQEVTNHMTRLSHLQRML